MSDPLKPELTLLMRLGSIVVHADELTSPGMHYFDADAIRALLDNADVKQWIKDMGVYLPVKR